MTAEFGTSNAGKAWLRRVESLTSTRPDPALVPARRIARQNAGAVAISGHTVRVVLSERRRQHDIALAIPTWSHGQARTVSQLLADAKLVPLDDLPDGLLSSLHAHQIDLAPELDQIQVQPTTAPRRHTLAALYRLIQLLDEEPQRALSLRLPRTQAGHSPAPAEAAWIPLADLHGASFYGRTS